MKDNELKRAARWYASNGWPVIPLHPIRNGVCTCGRADCSSPAKHPRTANGLKDATTDANTIDRWWRRWPDANVGVCTGGASGIVVIDIDPRHGGDDSLAELERANSTLPTTAEVMTGGGGRHLFFKHPGSEVRNRSNVRPGIDVRGDGGYIVAPPSVHLSGGVYAWRPGHGPDEMEPAEMPGWLVDLIRRDEPAPVKRDKPAPSDDRQALCLKACLAMQCTDNADGSKRLYAAACRCVEHDLADAEAVAIVRAYETARPFPRAWSDAEIVQRIRDAERRATRGKELHKGRQRSGKPKGSDGSPSNDSGLDADGNGRAAAETAPTPEVPWPNPAGEAAFHGLAGDIVRAIEPHSEADPMALLLQVLVAFGSAAGRAAYYRVEGTDHYGNLFAVLVGATSKALKGTAWAHIRRLLQSADESWARERVASGLSSGEGLIWPVRDPIVKQESVKVKGRRTGETEEVVVDPGVDDKRLLVVESEFASTLRVLGRDGNTLSAVIRQAWDFGDLRSLTKNSPARATGAHISIVGHVTRDELRRYLDTTEAGNGFGNRILWACVRRSKCLPEGGNLGAYDFGDILRRLGAALDFARTPREVGFDGEARPIWHKVYPELSEGKPGLFGATTSRAEAQTMRLATLYALLDSSPTIRVEHLTAALAVWEYCEASARHIFGDATGDPVSDEVLRAMRQASDGLTRTDLFNALGRHISARRLAGALTTLLASNLAVFTREETGGRPAERWFAVSGRSGVSSLTSLSSQ